MTITEHRVVKDSEVEVASHGIKDGTSVVVSVASKEKIIENENKLLEAMKNGDVSLLDDLLHDHLLFNLPNGQTTTKMMDLEMYRSGKMTVVAITPSEQIISLIDDAAVVATTIEIKGKYHDQVLDGKFRYLRIWKLFGGYWKVIAGSAVQL